MHEMQTVMVPCVLQSHCLSIMCIHVTCCANTAEWIEVLLGVETLLDQRYIILDRSPDFRHRFNVAFPILLCRLLCLVCRHIVISEFSLSVCNTLSSLEGVN